MPKRLYSLTNQCHNCGNTFGEHRTADAACPIYIDLTTIDGRQWRRPGGFSQTSKFLNLYS